MKTNDDKYSAVWLSHSSISDFLKCPRLYYYNNVYKNPKSGRKITIVNPPLVLGQVVHGVIDDLSSLPSSERLTSPLRDRLDEKWKTIEGKKGGFSTESQEKEYKERAYAMLDNIHEHPGPITRKAVKIKQDLPHYWLSEEKNLILCGKIDWIEYLEETDSIHVIDFKTGRSKEKEGSLQLPIYYLLIKNTQNRNVVKMSYWYLQTDDEPLEVPLPDYEESLEKIMNIGERMRLARQLNHFICSKDEKNGCTYCGKFEAIVKGQGEFVGVGEYNKEVYILKDEAVAL